MSERASWHVVASVALALLVAALLMSTPTMIFAKQVNIIDTELRESTGSAQRVLAKRDLGDVEQLSRIPTRLGPWNMSLEHDWDRVAEILNTDVLLSRDYAHPNLLQSTHLLVIQSHNVSSFHPAPVCYRVQGWLLPEDGGQTVSVPVPNATWAKESWLSDAESNVFSGNVSAKLLEVTKEDANGTVTDKRVALYVYLKQEDWHITNSVTWVRVEMVLPASSPATEALPLLQDLLGRALPELFTFEDREEQTLAGSLASAGPGGWALLSLSVAAPLGYVAYATVPPHLLTPWRKR